MKKKKPQANYVQVDVEVPVCPRCGSSERTSYHNLTELGGAIIRGQWFGRIQLRRTSCKQCGQHRVERAFFQDEKSSALRSRDVSVPRPDAIESPACIPPKKSAKKSKRSTKKSRRA